MPLGLSSRSVGMIPLGEVAALLSAAAWAVTSLLVRFQMGRFGPVAINVIRSAVAGGLAVLAAALLRGDRLAAGVSPVAFGLLLTSVVLSPGLGDTLYFVSLRLIGVARAMPLAGTNPLFAAVLAIPLLGEPVSPRMAIGIVLVLLGIYLVAGRAAVGKAPDLRRGAAAALGAAVLWAASSVALAPAMREVDVLVASAIRLPLTMLVTGLYGWRTGGLPSLGGLSRRMWLVVLAIGIGSAACTMLYLLAVQQAGAARTTALFSTSPLFATPLAILLYREPVTSRLLSGTAVSIIGIMLIVAG